MLGPLRPTGSSRIGLNDSQRRSGSPVLLRRIVLADDARNAAWRARESDLGGTVRAVDVHDVPVGPAARFLLLALNSAAARDVERDVSAARAIIDYATAYNDDQLRS